MLGKRNYLVRLLASNKTVKPHVNQMRKGSYESDHNSDSHNSSDSEMRYKRVQISKDVSSLPEGDSDVGDFGPDLQNLFKSNQSNGSHAPANQEWSPRPIRLCRKLIIKILNAYFNKKK